MEELTTWTPWVAVAFHVLIVVACGWVLLRWSLGGMIGKLRGPAFGLVLSAVVAALQIVGFSTGLVGGSIGQTWPKLLAAVGAVIEFGACLLAMREARRFEHGDDAKRDLPGMGVLQGAVGTAGLTLLVSILFLLFLILIRWDSDPSIIKGTKPFKSANVCNSASGYVCPATEQFIWRPTAVQRDIDVLIDRGRPNILTKHDGYVVVQVYDLCDGDSEVRWSLAQDGESLGAGVLRGAQEVRIEAGPARSQNLHLEARRLNGGSCGTTLGLKP
ncbi:hypothetical protein [Microlunatus sp. GCM10028923]|uniref:hypothetical protein n=1 Tax=Microlunatus sp. GCM10028923 TaxID=3273400 RepID=UPI003608DB5C